MLATDLFCSQTKLANGEKGIYCQKPNLTTNPTHQIMAST
jgi:hypothetical protein